MEDFWSGWSHGARPPDDAVPGTASLDLSLGPSADPSVVGEVATDDFEAFYATHFRALVTLAFALSGSRLVAEDVAQEALLAAYRRWPEVAALDQPAAWVRRVVANRSVSVVRRRISEARAVTRLGGRREAGPTWDLGLGEDASGVWRQVRRLPRRQAQVVALFYVEDLALEDVATVLECSVETVRTHLRRARKTLADRLRAEEGDTDGPR